MLRGIIQESKEDPAAKLWYFCAFSLLAVAGGALVLSVFECAEVFK